MNYKSFNLGDWIGHISGAIEDERKLDENEMRDLVKFLSKMPKWIPVSKRLPKKRDGYYVTLKGIGELEGVTETAIATWIDGWLYCHVDEWELKEVIAWMPLPKQYREGKSKRNY